MQVNLEVFVQRPKSLNQSKSMASTHFLSHMQLLATTFKTPMLDLFCLTTNNTFSCSTLCTILANEYEPTKSFSTIVYKTLLIFFCTYEIGRLGKIRLFVNQDTYVSTNLFN